MKHLYSALATGLLLVAGTMNAEARFWTYDATSPVEVETSGLEAGKWYALQGGQSLLGGYYAFISGTLHTTSTNLTTENLYQFVDAGETTADGTTVYYVKRYDGTYLYAPAQSNFYGPAVERAWKVAVRPADVKEKDFVYEGYDENEELVEYTGMDAYIQKAIDENDPLDLSAATYCEADNAVVIASAEPDDETAQSTYTYVLGLGENVKTGSVTRGTNYNTNTWVLYVAEEQSAVESLHAIIFEITNGDMDIDLSEYQLGTGAGEYDADLHKKFMELWEKAIAVLEGELSLSDAEIDAIAEGLQPALEAFKNSGKGLTEGYYILRSMRPSPNWTEAAYPWGRNGSDYDDGAIYDGSVVNSSDANLRWSYKADDEVEFWLETLDKTAYETAKFVWHAYKSGTTDDDGNELYYFENIETGKFIGKDPKTYSPVVMHDTPQVGFTIAANPNFPGWFSFYSPELTLASEDSRFPADYSGLHCSSDVNNVVAWDWRVGGSCWKVETLTEDEVELLKENLEGPQRLAALTNLVAEAEEKITNGYSYDALNADGTKSEYGKTGSLELDGLVVSVDQIACPMNETQEGSLDALFDIDKDTYMHSTWSGAWVGDHFLQMTIEEPESDLLFKWVKRDSRDNGAPKDVVIWGTNNEEDLEVNEAEGASTAEEYNAWQQTWKELGKGTFEYTLADEQKNLANTVGFLHVQLTEPVKYIRMAVKTRVADGDVPNGNKYFHGAEFRLYRAALNLDESPISAVPEAVLKELEEAIELAKEEIADGEATEATLKRLQEAYDKFIEFYPAAERLTNVIADAKELVDGAVEGDGLGYYENGAIAALEAAIATAEAAVKPVMTNDEINSAKAALEAAIAAFNAALHVPASGLYVITSNSSNETVYGKALTATYASTADNVKLRGGAEEANTDLRAGSYWQTEKVDGGYTFKNLYTGMYLAPFGKKKDAVVQSNEPYVFELRYSKEPGSFNLVLDEEDAYGGTYVYVNAQPGYGNVVTWSAASGRDNSAFTFTAAVLEDVDYKLADSGMLFDVPYVDAPQAYTFPVDMDPYVSGEAGAFYTVLGQNASNNNIELVAVPEGTVLKAGFAYIYVPAEGKESETALFFQPEGVNLSECQKTNVADSENGLVGVFESVKLTAGYGVFSTDHKSVLVSEENDVVAAGTGYFAKMPETTQTGDITILCNGNISSNTGIVNVIDNRKENTIYTISGVRMNSTKNLPAGLYIIGGKKYIVK